MSKELQFKGIKGHSKECNDIMNKLFLVKESNGVQFHLLEEEIHDLLFKMNEEYCNLLDWLDDIARREYEEQFNEEEVITIPCSEYEELQKYKKYFETDRFDDGK